MTNKTNDSNDLIEKDVQSHDQLQIMESRAKDAQQFGELLGSLRTHTAYHKLSEVARLQNIAQIKDSKYYQTFLGEMVEIGGVPSDLGKWENFCLHYFGETESSVNKKLKNLAAFGAEMMESFAEAGIGVRKMTALRKLPEGELSEVVQTITASDDKEEIAELVTAIISKSVKEKEALAKQLEHEKLETQAQIRVVEQKEAKINELNKEIIQQENITLDDKIKTAYKDLNEMQTDAIKQVKKVRALVESAISLEDKGIEHTVTAMMLNIRNELDDIIVAFGLEYVELNRAIDDSWIGEHEEQMELPVGLAPDEGDDEVINVDEGA